MANYWTTEQLKSTFNVCNKEPVKKFEWNGIMCMFVPVSVCCWGSSRKKNHTEQAKQKNTYNKGRFNNEMSYLGS